MHRHQIVKVNAIASASAWEALHRAAADGDSTAVEQHLTAGTAVDAADEQGCTALHKAAQLGHSAVVQVLLAAHAAVDAADAKGLTALHNA